MKLKDHPTVVKYRERTAGKSRSDGAALESEKLRQTILAVGVDDVGFSSLDGHLAADEAEEIRKVFPAGKTAISLVCRLNPESIRSLSRSTSDLEFLLAMKRADHAAHAVAAELQSSGVRAFTPSAGFPMDTEKWPDRMWPVSHKLIAESSGMGIIGRNRLLLHPRFGAFVVLGSVILDRELDAYDEPLDYDPCLVCGYCAAVCPVGAVAGDGFFGFTTCLTHNYRDRLGGFSQWVEEVVSARNTFDYRRRITDAETVSIWQAMTYGISNKCSYCMAVCPAGDEVIGPFIEDRKGFRAAVVRPLQEKEENVYVIPESDGEAHLAKRFPHKKARRTGSGIRANSITSFIDALPLAFNRNQSKGFKATYHLVFTGDDSREVTVVIDDRTLEIEEGLKGESDLRLTADGQAWLQFLTSELGLPKALLTGKMKVKGSPALMKKFAACFPL